MARIRTIKPEFVESESIGKLSRDARLLFIQLWTFVDDVGRARASSRLLASRLYPYDADAPTLIGHWLEELELGGHVRMYEVDGDRYLDIPKWLKHQKIDHASKSRLPEYREGTDCPREDSREPRASYLGPSTVGPSTKDQDNSTSRKALSADTRGTRLPEDWQPSEEDRTFAVDLGLDSALTAEGFRDYWHALPGAKGRKLDWSKTFRNRCRDLGKGHIAGAPRETHDQRRIRLGREALRDTP